MAKKKDKAKPKKRLTMAGLERRLRAVEVTAKEAWDRRCHVSTKDGVMSRGACARFQLHERRLGELFGQIKQVDAALGLHLGDRTIEGHGKADQTTTLKGRCFRGP